MTSVTISTTFTYDNGRDAGGGDYGSYKPKHRCGDESQDIGGCPKGKSGNPNIDAVLDNMAIPEGIKDMLRKLLAMEGEMLPSEANAVNTMQKFQNDHKDKLGLISYDQLKDVASGKTDQINGVKVPDDVKEAAKAYVANNGALFDKVESAVTGKHDSLLSAADADKVDRSQLSRAPTIAGTSPESFMCACANGHISPNEPEEYDAVKTMGKFQKDNDIGLISYDQMKKIASGELTELNGKKIPEDVRDAAKTYVADHGALFDKVESANDGKHDSQLSAGDADKAIKNGSVAVPPMSEKGAVDTIEKFQKDGGPNLISADEMQGIAKGEITKLGGKEVTPEVRAAAQTYMANHGALFDKIEAAMDGKHDSKLGSGDPQKARDKGISLSDRVPGEHKGEHKGRPGGDGPLKIEIDISGKDGKSHYSIDLGGPPSHHGKPGPGEQRSAADTRAVETIEKFQRDGGPGLISYDDLKGIASGDIKKLGGKEVTPEVKAAAQAYVADNGALFDKIESAATGKHDSQLSADDASRAREKDQVGMSDGKAVDTVAALQNDPKAMLEHGMKPGDMLSFDHMKEMADKGTLNGRPVSNDLKMAAEAYVADHGALFDKVESATTGKHDSLLSAGDAKQAHEKNLLGA